MRPAVAVAVLAVLVAPLAPGGWNDAYGQGRSEGRGLGPFGEGQGRAHAVFKKNCQECHSHLGEIAYDTLVAKGERLVSKKSGRDAAEFLLRHGDGLVAAEAALVVEAMRRQMESAHRFREQCAICHVRIRDVAAELRVTADGRLTGLYSGRDMAEFLPSHGRLDATEADRFARILRRTVEGQE
jgi:hypothetical protein